ncbi:Com family DNA-binding transcriptional regulator [Azotosporobacter soli]|uniref:Com family DNA-binding transcriptional regulator n=1 Tax=Azotosporobacter soli TaxID=3055040 RepID=UPI0031FF19EE
MYKEFRCLCCGKLLFKGQIHCVEIKCPRCHALQKLEGCEAPKNLLPIATSAAALHHSAN